MISGDTKEQMLSYGTAVVGGSSQFMPILDQLDSGMRFVISALTIAILAHRLYKDTRKK